MDCEVHGVAKSLTRLSDFHFLCTTSRSCGGGVIYLLLSNNALMVALVNCVKKWFSMSEEVHRHKNKWGSY